MQEHSFESSEEYRHTHGVAQSGSESLLISECDRVARIEAIAQKLDSLGLTLPAVFFLEAHLPFTAIFHTAGLMCEPMVAPLFGAERIAGLREFFSERENIEQLVERLRELERKPASPKEGA